MSRYVLSFISFQRTSAYRGVEQLVARRAHNPEVVGSNPSPATTLGGCNGFQLHPPVFFADTLKNQAFRCII